MDQKWRKRAATFVAGLMFIASSVTVLATVQGSQENPLITLSYLQNVFTQTILDQTDQKIEQEKTSLESQLDKKIATYTDEMKKLSASDASSASAVFSVVDVANGKTLTGAVGCEVMLRVGQAQCLSTSSPGLIDSTSGAILENGTSLVKNHLYMVTVEGRSVKAINGNVKLMVRGDYTIQ